MHIIPQVIECIPAATVEGTLMFVGLEGLFTTQLWERVMLPLEGSRLATC